MLGREERELKEGNEEREVVEEMEVRTSSLASLAYLTSLKTSA